MHRVLSGGCEAQLKIWLLFIQKSMGLYNRQQKGVFWCQRVAYTPPPPPYMSIHPLESQSVPELKSRCVNCAILFTSLKIKNIPKLTFTLSSNYLIKTIFFSLDNGNDSDIIRQTEDDHSKSLFETQTYSA